MIANLCPKRRGVRDDGREPSQFGFDASQIVDEKSFRLAMSAGLISSLEEPASHFHPRSKPSPGQGG
jgi:hypothetical protein